MTLSRLLALSLLFMLAGCTLTPTEAGFSRGPRGRNTIRHLNARYGAAALNQDSWGKLDAPTQIAIDFAETTAQRWLLWDTGFNLGQSEDGNRLSNGDRAEEGLTVLEVSGGVMAQSPRRNSLMRPYVGLGLSALWAESDLIEDDELVGVQDASLGLYGKAGLLFRIGDGSYLGLEARVLEASEINTATGSQDLGGMQVSVVFGASF